MSTQDIIRAWKDADYRASLSDAQRAALPDNPAGPIELTDADLGNVAAGDWWTFMCTFLGQETCVLSCFTTALCTRMEICMTFEDPACGGTILPGPCY